LAGKTEKAHGKKEREEAKNRILECLTPNPMKRAQLLYLTGLNPRRLSRALADLEREGKVQKGQRHGFWKLHPAYWLQNHLSKVHDQTTKWIMNKVMLPELFKTLGASETWMELERVKDALATYESKLKSLKRELAEKLTHAFSPSKRCEG
jgi:DNA-binding HxlR family transcriptional regulator